MADARLEVTDGLGRRIVPIDKSKFTLGRRESNDLRLQGTEVSRDHAVIFRKDDGFHVQDLKSRYGTFVNDAEITDQALDHGDQIRLGRGGGAEIVFLVHEATTVPERNTTTAVTDLRHIAALLEGMHALGSGRVLDDVLALVMDSAITVSGAERGFIMLANDEGELEFKLGRGRDRVALAGARFETSRKIPEEVFKTGESRIVADLMDGDLANVHRGTVALGIRNVHCVPLKLVRYVDEARPAEAQRRIGVVYLDSREKGSLMSTSTRAALETLATEAAVAIENARLYRTTLEKAKLDQEMRIAAEIQQALLPRAAPTATHFEAAALMEACRSIGGDFYDYIAFPDGSFGFALGDVAGKGPPAALLGAMLQGMFAAQAYTAHGPAEAIARVNQALYRRAIEARFVTLFYGILRPDGQLVYCNAGHNPPFLVGQNGVRRLETGGLIVGLFDGTEFEEETLPLTAGDMLVVFTDGVSEALSKEGEEFGDDRLLASIQAEPNATAESMLARIFKSVEEFAAGAVPNDDITALIVRYMG